MVDAVKTITEQAKGLIPSFSEGSLILKIVSWGITALIIGVIIGVLYWIAMNHFKYKHKIVIWEKVAGVIQVTGRDRAREIAVSTAGDIIFKTRRGKKYLPPPVYQTGWRTYFYYIREDGEWINFKMSDFDKDERKLGAVFLDKDARFARTQIQKILKERYSSPSVWEKYGMWIISVSTIIIFGVFIYLALDKFITIIQRSSSIIDSVSKLVDTAEGLVEAMSNLKQGGYGYIPSN